MPQPVTCMNSRLFHGTRNKSRIWGEPCACQKYTTDFETHSVLVYEQSRPSAVCAVIHPLDAIASGSCACGRRANLCPFAIEDYSFSALSALDSSHRFQTLDK